MADKYFKISKNNLPPVNAELSTYDVRMRIVSQDQNRTSSWSPIYSVYKDIIGEIPYSVSKNTVTTVDGTAMTNVNISWQDPYGLSSCDVYIFPQYYLSNKITHYSITDKILKFYYNVSDTFPTKVGDQIVVTGIAGINGTYTVNAVDLTIQNVSGVDKNSFSVYKNTANVSITAVTGSAVIDVIDSMYKFYETTSKNSTTIPLRGTGGLFFSVQRSVYPKVATKGGNRLFYNSMPISFP